MKLYRYFSTPHSTSRIKSWGLNRHHAPNSAKRVAFLAGLLIVLASPILSGCGVVTGIGAATGISAYQERGIEGAANDLKIQIRIIDNWLDKDNDMVTKIGLEVYQARVMLTGYAKDEKMRAEAVRLTWQAEGVKEVLNEIQLETDKKETSLARDSWITTQLKSKITFDQHIYAVNYFIETVNGIVYLLGVAQNKEEHNLVKAHARSLNYVRRVISHVRIRKPRITK
jgi:osmotically-inducible protein OsmY